MRDDLHRTVAVPAPWKTVLRYASNKVDRLARLPGAIQEAVRRTLKESVSADCLRALRSTVSHGLRDLFDGDAVADAIARCERTVVTSADRELYDAIRTAAAFKRQDENILVAAMGELANRAADRYCEHLVATVRIDHPRDAAELRGYLDTARRTCDFSRLVEADGRITSRPRRPREEIDLDEVIGP
jgi:hypothetical protein